jgi:rubrerythrin
MGDSSRQIMDILRKAYQVECDGHTFYSMVADRSERDAVREIFGKLSRDELEHKAYLREIGARYEQEGVSAFTLRKAAPDLRIYSDALFNDRFREQARGAAFEVSALSIGMQLESNAMSTFNNAARTATDAEVRDFYKFLADWEQQHLNSLHSLYEMVRDEIFADSGFSPF